MDKWFLTITLFFGAFKFTQASLGDRSFVFQKCLNNCSKINCTNLDAFEANHPLHLRLLGWTCHNECQQMCMWHTVDAFLMDGSPVPQFYGKWPFVRFLGLQEPASVLFSVLNAAGHLMLIRYRALIKSTTPMYYVWHGLALVKGVLNIPLMYYHFRKKILDTVSVNAWTWSIIFHTRDTNFTEMMDYFFALSVVLYNGFSLYCRVIGTDKWWKPGLAALFLTAVFLKHIYYLAFVHFDYGYNMKFNVSIGLCCSLGWLAWCYIHRRLFYTWRCAVTILGVNFLVLLELLDFPPLYWTLDAHALWHASTVPFNLLWWSFIIKDGQYLHRKEEEKKII